MKRAYTTAAEQYLRDNYTQLSHKEMASALGKTVVAVKNKCRGLKLKLSNPERGKRAAAGKKEKRKDANSAFDAFVAANYLTMPLKAISRAQGFSYCKVAASLKRQGLKVPDKLTQLRRGESAFQIGGQSFNKDKKQTEYMSAEAILKTVNSRFQAGHRPHNTHQIGTEVTIDGYSKIKIGEPNKWIFKHVQIYETHFGKLKKGLIVIFRDKNTQNFDIANLQAITRAEHARKNYDAEKGTIYSRELHDTYVAGVLKRKTGLTNADIPQELINLKRAQLQINRQLNHIQKDKKNESE